MAKANLAVLGFWLAAALFAVAGGIMMLRGKSGGAVFLALAAFWMIIAISQAKKS